MRAITRELKWLQCNAIKAKVWVNECHSAFWHETALFVITELWDFVRSGLTSKEQQSIWTLPNSQADVCCLCTPVELTLLHVCSFYVYVPIKPIPAEYDSISFQVVHKGFCFLNLTLKLPLWYYKHPLAPVKQLWPVSMGTRDLCGWGDLMRVVPVDAWLDWNTVSLMWHITSRICKDLMFCKMFLSSFCCVARHILSFPTGGCSCRGVKFYIDVKFSATHCHACECLDSRFPSKMLHYSMLISYALNLWFLILWLAVHDGWECIQDVSVILGITAAGDSTKRFPCVTFWVLNWIKHCCIVHR